MDVSDNFYCSFELLRKALRRAPDGVEVVKYISVSRYFTNKQYDDSMT